MPKRAKREPRRIVSLKAQLRDGETWQEVSIANISSSGYMAKADAPPQSGASVEIRHRGIAISGHVVRSEGRRFAVKANEPIDLGELLAKAGIEARSAHRAPNRPARLWHWRSKP